MGSVAIFCAYEETLYAWIISNKEAAVLCGLAAFYVIVNKILED